MMGFLESQREPIAAACAKHGVLRLDAFGSAVRGGHEEPRARRRRGLSHRVDSPPGPARHVDEGEAPSRCAAVVV